MKINRLLLLIFFVFGSLNAETANYKDFIKDEIPLIKSNNPNAVDIIEFSSFCIGSLLSLKLHPLF